MSESAPESEHSSPAASASRDGVGGLLRGLARPKLLFGEFSEPVKHEQVLALLSLVRFPAWLSVVAFLAVRFWTRDLPPLMTPNAIPDLDPTMMRVISIWALLMVPLGLPLLYFAGGLLAHLGLSLTGGGARSIGATMRAVGLAALPGLIVLSTVEILMYVPSEVNQGLILALVAAGGLLQYGLTAYGLAKSHRVSMIQTVFVAVLPVVLLCGVTLARVTLVVGYVPGTPPPPPEPYYVIPVTP